MSDLIPFTNDPPIGMVAEGPIPLNGGVQYRATFPNGRGASIIQGPYSYGGAAGLWELAVTNRHGLDYSTPLTSDVLGHLTPDEVAEHLRTIANLPPLEG